MEIHESTEQIRVRAHQLWEQAGRPHGHDVEHWLQAEKEILLNSAAAAPLMQEMKQELSDADSKRTKKSPKAAKKISGRSKAKQPL
jgi:hypothetical protein